MVCVCVLQMCNVFLGAYCGCILCVYCVYLQNIQCVSWCILQTLFDPFFISLYNVFYTSLPILALGIFDQVSCPQQGGDQV